MRRLLCFFLLFIATGSLKAQEEFIEPSRLLTHFSFEQLTGGVIMFHALLHPFPDTLNFILDTGSGGISLDSTTVAYFGLQPEPSNKTIRGIGGIRTVSFINNSKLVMPGLTVDNLNFHINNYEILNSVYGVKIDGIVGFSVLSRYIVKLNYDSSRVEFWSKGAIKYPRGGYVLRPIISTLPVQTARIKDDKTFTPRFLYDIGAGLNAMLSSDFVKDSNLFDKKRKQFIKQAEGMGGKVDVKLSVVKEMKLGPFRFRQVPVYIFDDVFNITSYPFMVGLIGSDLLRRFNSIINYDKREIYLVPNGHYREAFDYSYSGLELYYVDGRIIIDDVAENSPASRAGLHEGDEVMGINTNFSGNLQQYKLAIQNTGDKIKLFVRRDGELMSFELRVRNILK